MAKFESTAVDLVNTRETLDLSADEANHVHELIAEHDSAQLAQVPSDFGRMAEDEETHRSFPDVDAEHATVSGPDSPLVRVIPIGRPDSGQSFPTISADAPQHFANTAPNRLEIVHLAPEETERLAAPSVAPQPAPMVSLSLVALLIGLGMALAFFIGLML